jgi:tRNA(His) 5'-end guanylyltransferase
MLSTQTILKIKFRQLNFVKRYKQRFFEGLKASFEFRSTILEDCFILVQCDGLGFKNFTKAHKFHKPTDQRNVNLMNECTEDVYRQYRPEIICALGFSDEINFAFKSSTKLFDRKFK